jgi:outer membrane receptor protein involved in Fe transport
MATSERKHRLLLAAATARQKSAPNFPDQEPRLPSPPMKPHPLAACFGSLLAFAASLTLLSAQSTTSTTSSSPPAKDEKESVVQLSPFEVVSDNKGYYSGNTMSGTRLNSKLEDLGAAISVVTKEQMSDFALLDMNDIFNYEASTEGTGNYTDFAFNRNGEPESMTQLQPEIANRIRGVGNTNTTLGNFETSGRVPIDPIAIDSVEISRGPNSSIFGIGSVAGNVNAVPSAANITRNFSRFSSRVDSFEGYRFTTDLNRVLLRNKLAVRPRQRGVSA